MMRAAGLISSLTMLSRLLGLVREQVFAALLGAGFHADAFNAAFRIPNLLRDLFAEGALSAAFVPTYARAMAEGEGRAHQLANRLLTVLGAVLAVLVGLGLVFAEPLVRLLVPGFEEVPGELADTVRLAGRLLGVLARVAVAALAG